jgi:hypothetical protein
LAALVEIRTGLITNETENVFALSDKGLEFVFGCRTERAVVEPVQTLCNKMQCTVQQRDRKREREREVEREREKERGRER